ncbi:hypothetical protein C4552_01395 [Candidatus Parcubacteria bacterium]|nr:MAG: hypothetical protein C4552_01395 [Candidatus Parcubacteria bacterium]
MRFSGISRSPADPDAALKQRVMRRVYTVWFWKSVAPLLAVEGVLLVGVAAGVMTQISLRQILLNALAASDGLTAFVQFFVDNFFVKSMQSRLLVIAYLAIGAFFARDIRNALARRSAAFEEFLSPLAISVPSRR